VRITVDTLVGWLLTLTPAGLLAWGLFGLIMPAVWHTEPPRTESCSTFRPTASCRSAGTLVTPGVVMK
jgi:hypothetical protein